MCGIAGIVARDGFDPRLLISMTHAVAHRGPDGYGFAFFGCGAHARGEFTYNEDRLPSVCSPVIGLGNRRLAILDLSPLGNQPMQSEDGNACITYNGEIHNYLEIRATLEARGHRFKTRTDTEVLLHAYQEWGSASLTKCNGMWSFAIWDSTRRMLFCARDRFGVKPFFYFASASSFLFGSEIKQILQWPGLSRAANEGPVIDYLEQGLLGHSEETFFKGVHELPAAHFLTLDLTKPSMTPVIQPYWSLEIKEPNKMPAEEACGEFFTRFNKAVALRMRSDVAVGSCLSGGLDSSAIVCTAARHVQHNGIHSFSSCSDDAEGDEQDYINEVVASARLKPHWVFPDAERFWADLNRLLWHQEQPIGGMGVYAQWRVMEAARRERVPVLLDGQGGDETLCGYRKFHFLYLWQLLKNAEPSFLREGLLWPLHATRPRWNWPEAGRYFPVPLARPFSVTSRVCHPEFQRKHRDRHRRLAEAGDLRERQKADLTRYSLPELLRYEDRNSMAHSIEARVPFLDHELAEFLVNCAPALKLHRGWSKWILRQALKGILPERVRLRKTKLAFHVPQRQWMQRELKSKIKAAIAFREFRMGRFLRVKNVAREFDKFWAGDWTALPATALFRVLNLELWARVYEVE